MCKSCTCLENELKAAAYEEEIIGVIDFIDEATQYCSDPGLYGVFMEIRAKLTKLVGE